MSSTMTDEGAKRRAQRRRHLQQRQTIVFGGIVTILIVIGLSALGVFSGLLPAPIDRPFATPSPEGAPSYTTPCPPEGALPVALDQISANVLNSTSREGLAGSVGGLLSAAGVVVESQANFAGATTYEGTAMILTGPSGVAQAYSIAALFPDSEVFLLTGRAEATVDVVLGAAFDEVINDPATSQLPSDQPIAAPEGCSPLTAATDAESA